MVESEEGGVKLGVPRIGWVMSVRRLPRTRLRDIDNVR
jgi:hypothetical protein